VNGTKTNFTLFMADSLLEQVSALQQEIGGVLRADDIEYVHRMRVASRRLRTRLAIFEKHLPKAKVTEWQKNIRRVTRALGDARDKDVQIKIVRKYLKNLSNGQYRPGIRRLLFRLRQCRTGLQNRVVKSIRRLRENKIIEDIENTARQIRARALMKQTTDTSNLLLQVANQAISARLEEMLGWELYVDRVECIKELHAMRIAAKHFRYTMEALAPLYESGLEDHIAAARRIQTMLGDIHDCDVWAQFLPAFIEEEGKKMEEYFGHNNGLSKLKPGINSFKRDRSKMRRTWYRKFTAFWHEINGQGSWNKLMSDISAEIAAPQII